MEAEPIHGIVICHLQASLIAVEILFDGFRVDIGEGFDDSGVNCPLS